MKHLKLDDICQQLLSFCNNPQILGKPICIAYSGGVDSQVLLHAFSVLEQQNLLTVPIKAIHVNHGLSANATAWQKTCKEQARQYNIAFETVSLSLKPQKQVSLESLARDARYQQLEQLNDSNTVIMTAHHQDDQVETFLLALKRGAGVQGLSAMQQIRTLNSSTKQLLARPLLSISRAEIEHYAKRNKLTWVEDESNTDQQFDRNFIRAQVLPLLQQRWPAFNQTVARSAQHCQQTHSLVEQLAEQDLKQCQSLDVTSESNREPCLSIDAMAGLSIDRIQNLIRYFLQVNHLQMPSTMQLKEIINACFYSGDDRNPEIHLGQHTLRCFQRDLYLTPKYKDISDWRVEWRLSQLSTPKVVELPDDLGQLELFIGDTDPNDVQENHWCIDVGNLNNARLENSLDTTLLSIKFTHDNPKCLPSFRHQRRPLKKVLQELKIPTWQRKRLPFVCIMEQLVTVLPLFVCKEYLVEHHKKCLNIIWHKKS